MTARFQFLIRSGELHEDDADSCRHSRCYVLTAVFSVDCNLRHTSAMNYFRTAGRLTAKATCVALVALAAGSAAVAQEDAPMRFSVFNPCLGNARVCGARILAQGVIMQDTARAFEAFLAAADVRKQLPPVPAVSFDSPGGSLIGGIELGRVIRRLKMETIQEPEYSTESFKEPYITVFAPRARCASACVLAYLGGTSRSVMPGSRIGVHQFAVSQGSLGDGATQSTVVAIAAYIELMGVKRALLDRASMTPASQIYWLTPGEIKAFQVDNMVPALSPWVLKAMTNGTPMLQLDQQLEGGRTVQLRMAYFEKRFVVAVGLVLATDLVTADRIALFPNGDPPVLEFVVDGKRLRTSPIGVWQRFPAAASTSYRGNVELTAAQARTLVGARKVKLADDFPHPLMDLSLGTDISIEGLGSGVSLLLRNGG